MARPLKPLVRGGGYYPSRKWTPLVYKGGYTTMDGAGEPEPPVEWQTVTGVSPLTLVNSLAHAIKSITQYGKCVQDGTPTPSSPVDIKCNNGAIKVSANLLDPTAVPNENKYVSAGNGGETTPSSGTFRHSNYIRIVGGEEYFFGMTPYSASTAGLAWYSAADPNSYISGVNGTSLKNAGMVATAPASANYVRFSWMIDSGYDTDWQNSVYICVNGLMSAFRAFGEVYIDGTPEVLTVCGKNIFDQSWFDTDVGATITYKTYDVPNGTYTMSTNLNRFGNATCNVFIGAGASLSPSSANNGVSYETPRTITVIDGKYTVAYRSKVSDTEHNPKDFNWQLEQGSTATNYEPYTAQTASVSDLFAVGDYKDEQDIISGLLTHRVGINVFDGTENWREATHKGVFFTSANMGTIETTRSILCNAFSYSGAANASMPNYTGKLANTSAFGGAFHFVYDEYANDVDGFTAWLAAQYAAGTPVIVTYPLADETTETVTAQPLSTVDGTNTVTAVSNVDPVTLSVEYASSEEE